MDTQQKSLQKHEEWQGKIEVISRAPITNKEELSLAYTPGVAAPCLAIHEDPNKSFTLTRRGNLVAVITDGSAVLGLGNIGPKAGMPVMEGKCALFKTFADVDAFPICISSQDTDTIVDTIVNIADSFGGINLEDIAAPRCFEVEKRLKEKLDIPVFHDDQHGTAIVAGAALINALKIVNKQLADVKIVINGAGAAGIAIAKHLLAMGAKNVILADRQGLLYSGREGNNDAKEEISRLTNLDKQKGTLADGIKNADVFLGVSAAGAVNQDMVRSMNEGAILFPMANPTPEIFPDEAIAAGAKVVGTGRSDFPNQINNVLAFPGIFKGAISVRATQINDAMCMAATYAIADCVKQELLSPEYIIPAPFDKSVAAKVTEAVAKAAIDSGVARQ
ncbi:MAG: malic enzyme-like NAD(P)-binding protein [Eubacteriales bacterium]|nr:malic enzyme-like NAD(P)-binding protein [Eubacteriales bacterium]